MATIPWTTPIGTRRVERAPLFDVEFKIGMGAPGAHGRVDPIGIAADAAAARRRRSRST
jgi:hypothetical protein